MIDKMFVLSLKQTFDYSTKHVLLEVSLLFNLLIEFRYFMCCLTSKSIPKNDEVILFGSFKTSRGLSLYILRSPVAWAK